MENKTMEQIYHETHYKTLNLDPYPFDYDESNDAISFHDGRGFYSNVFAAAIHLAQEKNKHGYYIFYKSFAGTIQIDLDKVTDEASLEEQLNLAIEEKNKAIDYVIDIKNKTIDKWEQTQSADRDAWLNELNKEKELMQGSVNTLAELVEQINNIPQNISDDEKFARLLLKFYGYIPKEDSPLAKGKILDCTELKNAITNLDIKDVKVIESLNAFCNHDLGTVFVDRIPRYELLERFNINKFELNDRWDNVYKNIVNARNSVGKIHVEGINMYNEAFSNDVNPRYEYRVPNIADFQECKYLEEIIDDHYNTLNSDKNDDCEM